MQLSDPYSLSHLHGKLGNAECAKGPGGSTHYFYCNEDSRRGQENDFLACPKEAKEGDTPYIRMTFFMSVDGEGDHYTFG